MATLALGTDLTLAELIRRETPDNRLADLVDVLSETNKVLVDATWIECNNGKYHEDTQTASEPAGQERAYDQGVAKEAGVTEKITEETCMLDGLSEIDAAKLKHAAGGDLANRLLEDQFFLRGMGKTGCSRIFDGNRATNVLQINGINNRSNYNALSSSYTYDNADGNASATANKTSVYLFQWGYKKVNLIYPRNDPQGNSEYGIKMEDFGKNIISDADVSTRKYPAWQTWFEFHFGIFIHDPRCIKRQVNISTTNIDGVDDFSWYEDSLIDMVCDLEYDGDGAVLYCNKAIFKQAWKRAKDKGNVNFTIETGPFGKKITSFQGIPFRRVDQITSTQSTIL
ncbi:MAG: major capsid protein [Planctomycetota bacterium]|jgi:hypothetical protein